MDLRNIKKILEILLEEINKLQEIESKRQPDPYPVVEKQTGIGVEIKYLSLPDSAKYLGITKSTLYKFNMKREIPYYTGGGRKIFYKIADLDNWIEKGKRSSQEEIEREAQRYIDKMRK